MTTNLHSQILYAAHDGGIDLAVVDITNPAFRVVITDEEIAAMAERHLIELPKQTAATVTPEIQEAVQQSQLWRSLRAASGGFLSWMPTYVMKLGPENLGAAETSPIDRHIVASFPALALRIRLQDMARLLADGVAGILKNEQQRQVCFVNIAGGAASDSWNALILLQAEGQTLLAGRDIVFAVLDLDESGPAFGRRAVAALQEPGAPLSGVDVSFRQFPYVWSDVRRLEEVLRELDVRDAACAISSEGGLFEYGTDDEVIANLRVLRAETADDAVIAGSVTRESELMRVSQSMHGILLKPRTIEAFRALVEGAGWAVERVIERPLSYHVLLTKRKA